MTRAVRIAAAFAAAAAIAAAAACSKKSGGGGFQPPVVTQCDAGLPSFVRNASLALLGRRPLGEKEVESWIGGRADTPANRVAIAKAMMNEPEFVDRWRDVFEDLLRVPRVDDQEMSACYGANDRVADDGALARYVASHPATDAGDGAGLFTMRDLLESAIRADDLSPVYRAHLFALVAFPIPAANVPPVPAELARRQDYGNVFDSAYLNRDLVCLQCHNSEFSVTYDADPAKNRHWPMPGLFEKALYGASNGTDSDAAHAVFRYDGFVGDMTDPGDSPWGWSGGRCGRFHPTLSSDDPAGIDAKFGAITGPRVSVYDVEKSLRAGVDGLAANGLTVNADGSIDDPDAAFAWLVAASISEGVWKEVVGSGLTIANYFPRNQASRDELVTLTTDFSKAHFSLRTLLLDVVTSPYFNQLPPSAGCTATAYSYPNVWDPWVIGDVDPAKRLNSSADGVSAVPARVMIRAGYSALNWPLAETDFPQNQSDEDFFRGVGLFLKNSERGFRGLDFQARLVWENRIAACANPGGSPDFVDGLLSRTSAKPDATVRDVVAALKDRLLDEPFAPAPGSAEESAVAALYGVTLDTPASSVSTLSTATRKLCGIYLSTPQFLLSGFAYEGTNGAPVLAEAPPSH